MKANKVKQQYNVYTELPKRVCVCVLNTFIALNVLKILKFICIYLCAGWKNTGFILVPI